MDTTSIDTNLAKLKIIYKIYIRFLVHLDYKLINKFAKFKKEKTFSNALREHIDHSKSYLEKLSHSFSSFMLRSFFLQNCEKAGSDTCDDYDKFIKLIKNSESYDKILTAINSLSKSNQQNVNIAELLGVLKDENATEDAKKAALKKYSDTLTLKKKVASSS